MKISFYPRVNRFDNQSIMDIGAFVQKIRNGEWMTDVLNFRKWLEDNPHAAKKEISKYKSDTFPIATISGVFQNGNRSAKTLLHHSGYIAMDFDGIPEEIEEFRNALLKDPYVYAAFTSVSGAGMCVILKIEPERHLDAFNGACKYFFENYNKIADPSGKDVCRPRYVSYDPLAIHAMSPTTFTKYPPKKQASKRKPVKFIHQGDDFSEIISQLAPKNICEDYHDWVSVGYALADGLGEAGREYFHALSSSSSKYDRQRCDRQYSAILRTNTSGKNNRATLATIYYYAKLYSIPFYSDRTREIINQAVTLKKSKLTPAGAIDNMAKHGNIPRAESEDIVKQVFETNVEETDDDNQVDQIARYLKVNYSLKRNEVTREIENDGIPLSEYDMNSIYLELRRLYEDLSQSLFNAVIMSNIIPSYNPLKEWFEARSDRPISIGHIDKLFDSVICTSDSPNLHVYGRKWIRGVIASIYGHVNPLQLNLVGEPHTGKSTFLLKLLPKEIDQKYRHNYGLLNLGKDDLSMMAKALVLFDDDALAPTAKQAEEIKKKLQLDSISIREPYGRVTSKRPRLASFCATANDRDRVVDPTGDRRNIIAEVVSIDHEAYNAVDKELLWMEAYHEWKNGYSHELTADEVAELMQINAGNFRASSLERDLVEQYIHPAKNEYQEDYVTATDIKVWLENQTNQRLSLRLIGLELRAKGFRRVSIRDERGYVHKKYRIQKLEDSFDFGGSNLPFGD